MPLRLAALLLMLATAACAAGIMHAIPSSTRQLVLVTTDLRRLSTSVRAAEYHDAMKAILASMLLAGAAFALAGCEAGLPPNQRPGAALERGFRGQGTITQPDNSEDPLIRESSRVGH